MCSPCDGTFSLEIMIWKNDPNTRLVCTMAQASYDDGDYAAAGQHRRVLGPRVQHSTFSAPFQTCQFSFPSTPSSSLPGPVACLSSACSFCFAIGMLPVQWYLLRLGCAAVGAHPDVVFLC